MSDLKQYVQDAIRTESQIDTIQVNIPNLISILKVYVAIGNLLDDLKKNIYYGKNINSMKWLNQLSEIITISPTINKLPDVADQQTLNVDPRLFHAIVGLATESTELVEAILKAIENETDIDHVNVQEELGDLNWYQAIAVDASDADWDKILETNINKLKHRYPEKFTSKDAINRDLDTERQILEGVFMQAPISTHPGRLYVSPTDTALPNTDE